MHRLAPARGVQIVAAAEQHAVDQVDELRDQRKRRPIRQQQRQPAGLLDRGRVAVWRFVAREIVVVVNGDANDGSARHNEATISRGVQRATDGAIDVTEPNPTPPPPPAPPRRNKRTMWAIVAVLTAAAAAGGAYVAMGGHHEPTKHKKKSPAIATTNLSSTTGPTTDATTQPTLAAPAKHKKRK